jgi:2-iminobutanoate/2-iminopropanoate deaminase
VDIIRPDGVAAPSAAYSHATQVGNMLFLAGQVAYDETGAVVGVGDVAAQTRQTIHNVRLVLEAAGFRLRDVAQTTVYLTDLANFAMFNEAYLDSFEGHKPARATVRAELVLPELLVEIQAIAVKD